MKSRCCTFYKNTSESTSLCKLDTDSSPCPVPSCSPAESNPEHKGLSAHIGLGINPQARGKSWRAPSLWTVPPSLTFHAGGSAPARLLVLLLSSSLAVQRFFCCYSLSPGNQWTVVCVPRLRFVSISLSPQSFSLSTAPVQFPNSHLQELSACVGNGRAESEAALSQECEGRDNYLLLPWGSALCPGPAATLEPWEVNRGLQKHATLVFFFIYIYISIFQFKFAEQMEEVAGAGNNGVL